MNWVFVPLVVIIVLTQGNKELVEGKEEKDLQESDHYEKECLTNYIWTIWENDTCKCGDDLYGIVNCDPITLDVSVMDCHCLTTEVDKEGKGISLAGLCLLNCENITQATASNIIYHPAPSDCSRLKRQGTLCGQCKDGYTVPAYSYEFKCIRCDSERENWGLYITFAFLPLTVFIIIILVFRINVLSPKLFLFVFSAQALSLPALIKVILNYVSLKDNPPVYKALTAIVFTFYGIWNLDFARVDILPEVCINAPPIQILLLDYLVAVYPMMLMATLYILVEIHSFGFEPVLCVWRPFHRFLARFRRHWGIETTIIDAFATFFFLSTTKLFSVSFALLMATIVYTSDGRVYSWRLYYDPSITYFGKEHLPYALIAIGVIVFLIILPTSLLFCYQFRPYRRCLVKCKIRGETLDEFVFTFQQYYKDGSNNTRDCRWFAGVFVSIKLLAYMVYFMFPDSMYYSLANIVMILGVSLIVIVEPYKEEYSIYNRLGANALLWKSLLLSALLFGCMSVILSPEMSDHYLIVAAISITPLVYLLLHLLIEKCRKREQEIISSLPHRLLHSNQY